MMVDIKRVKMKFLKHKILQDSNKSFEFAQSFLEFSKKVFYFNKNLSVIFFKFYAISKLSLDNFLSCSQFYRAEARRTRA